MEGGRLEAVRPMRGELSILCGVDDGLHQCGMCDEHDNHKGIVSLPYTARTMPEIYSECLIYIDLLHPQNCFLEMCTVNT